MINRKGFTLIELLVVIAIVGLLTTVVLVSMRNTRQKARDVKRISALTQIERALELYYADNGQYPPVEQAQTYSYADGCGIRWCTLGSYLAPYLSNMPQDPLGLQTAHRLRYDADVGDNYQSYGMMCSFEHSSNYHLTDEDNGYWQGNDPYYYEVGPQPAYCANNAGYSGGDRRWWGGGLTTVCYGGN